MEWIFFPDQLFKQYYIYDSKIHTKVRNIWNMHTIEFKVDYRYLLWDRKLKCNTRVGNSVTKQFYKVCSTRQAV
jgi:hypothetical protein